MSNEFVNIYLNEGDWIAIQKWKRARDSKADLCLKVLLEGNTTNRKKFNEMGMVTTAPSLISILRNEKYIPIISKLSEDNIVDYYMLPEEINRFKNPDLRQQQRDQMRELVEKKRLRRVYARLIKIFDQLEKSPKLWRYTRQVHPEFAEILTLLRRKKGHI